MPQTRFVLKKALEIGHRIIVVINKIDKPGARADFAVDKTFDLFVELGANSQTLDFPIIYASGREGKAGNENDLNKMKDISPIFDAILNHIPSPINDANAPLQILITSVLPDDFKGRIAIGRIHGGIIRAGQEIAHINRDGKIKKCRLVSLMTFSGLNKIEIKEASAGDIVAISGIAEATVGETVADAENPQALPLINIEEPTVKMTFMVNDSPFAGKEGEFTTSRQIKERIHKELETDIALKIEDTSDGKWIVSGRGELHLSILIERMRREGYEFQISRPRVIIKEINGKKMAPYERVFIEVPESYYGAVIQKLGSRKGELKEMSNKDGIVYLEFIVPTQGLFGYRNEFLTDTKGLGIMNFNFYEYRPDPGAIKEHEYGSLVAYESGLSNLYGLVNVQDRGVLFIGPGVEVYEGQVIGQNSRSEDIRVNICKTKQLSNMRSKNDGSSEHFNAPKIMGLEDSLEYIGDDELVEATPKSVRIRKIYLDENTAKRMSK